MLSRNPAEARALADDIFIHVTGFFRNPECFQALLRHGVRCVGREAAASMDNIRVWVPRLLHRRRGLFAGHAVDREPPGEHTAGTEDSDVRHRHRRARHRPGTRLLSIYSEPAMAGVSRRAPPKALFSLMQDHRRAIKSPNPYATCAPLRATIWRRTRPFRTST